MNWKQFQLARESDALQGKSDQGALLVLFVLISHADPQTAIAFPGEETIARESRMTDRGVREILVKLTARGFLTKLKGGSGRGLDEYLCHVEQGRKAGENRNTVPVKSELKPEPCSGLTEKGIGNNRNGGADNQEITGTVAQFEEGKTGTVTHAYKEEDKNKDIKSLIEESEESLEIPAPVQSHSSRSILSIHLPIAEAISGVCGMRFKSLSNSQFQQMTKSLHTILADSENIDFDEIPTEIELRFSPPIFTLANLPHLHQVGEWWYRQGVQKQHYQQTQKSTASVSEFASEYEEFKRLEAAGR